MHFLQFMTKMTIVDNFVDSVDRFPEINTLRCGLPTNDYDKSNSVSHATEKFASVKSGVMGGSLCKPDPRGFK
jgi:hypothetical protein